MGGVLICEILVNYNGIADTTLSSRSHPLVCVQPLLIDVVDYCRRQEVLDRHASADEKPDLCRTNIVVDELLDHKHVAPVLVQDVVRQQELIHVRSCSLQNQTSIFSDNVVKLFVLRVRKKMVNGSVCIQMVPSIFSVVTK